MRCWFRGVVVGLLTWVGNRSIAMNAGAEPPYHHIYFRF